MVLEGAEGGQVNVLIKTKARCRLKHGLWVSMQEEAQSMVLLKDKKPWESK